MFRIFITVIFLLWVPAHPVLLALPPGDQSKQLVMNGLHLYWEPQAKKRGWVVISPAAPEGTTFYTGAENEIPNLLDEVSKSLKFEGTRHTSQGLPMEAVPPIG